jgi:chloride channel protein, CIC family
VISPEKDLLGIIYFNDIREIIFSDFTTHYPTVKELMVVPAEVINELDTMETVMHKFETSGKVYLPVIKNGKYNGFIAKSDALEAYRNKLRAMVFE